MYITLPELVLCLVISAVIMMVVYEIEKRTINKNSKKLQDELLAKKNHKEE